MHIKPKRLFLKTFKCSRKLSCLLSGRALKSLSRPDGIPCLSPETSQEGGGDLCLLESWSPLGTAEGVVLPTSCKVSKGWTCHRWNWGRQSQVTPRQECSCVLYKKSEAVIQRVLQLKYLGALPGLARFKTATGPNTDLLWVAQAQRYAWTKTTSTHKCHVEWFGLLGWWQDLMRPEALLYPFAWSWLASAKISSRTPWQNLV